MGLLPGRNKLLPRQDSLPPPHTTACSGWDCLQQSQQFGVIFSIVLSVFTFAFLYWFLFWRRRGPATKKQQQDVDPEIVEIQLRSPRSSQTTAVIRLTPGDGKKNSRNETLFGFYKEMPQSGNELLRYPARRDPRYVPEDSSVSVSTTLKPQRVKGRKRAQSRNKQGSGILTAGTQSSTYNQAIEPAHGDDDHCVFCGHSHTISHQQRLLYMNQLGANCYSQQPRVIPRLNVIPTAIPGTELGQVPMVHCYPHLQPYVAPRYAPMPTITPAATIMPTQPLQATHFSQTVHRAQAVPIAQPFQPLFEATTKTEPRPTGEGALRSTTTQPSHPASAAHSPVYRDVPWWRKWVWRYPSTGRASTIDSGSHRSRSRSPESMTSRLSNHSLNSSHNRSVRRKSCGGGKDVRPTSRKRGRSPVSKRQEERSTELSQSSKRSLPAHSRPKHPQEQSKNQRQHEVVPDSSLFDLGSLPSHTTLDSESVHDCRINAFPRDKILADFERAKLAQSKPARTKAMGLPNVTQSSSNMILREACKDSIAEGHQRAPLNKQNVDKILITVSPPTSSTKSAKTVPIASGPGDGSKLTSTADRSSRLHPESSNDSGLAGVKRSNRQIFPGDGAEKWAKKQLSSPKVTAVRQDASDIAEDGPVRYRVDYDRDDAASLAMSSQAKVPSRDAGGSLVDNEASHDNSRCRQASRNREGRNLEVIDRESRETYTYFDYDDGLDPTSFRPKPPKPFTTEDMSDDADQYSAGDESTSQDGMAFKDGRSEVDSMDVQISPEAVESCQHKLPQSPSYMQGRKKRNGDSSEFFRFRGSDDHVGKAF